MFWSLNNPNISMGVLTMPRPLISQMNFITDKPMTQVNLANCEHGILDNPRLVIGFSNQDLKIYHMTQCCYISFITLVGI